MKKFLLIFLIFFLMPACDSGGSKQDEVNKAVRNFALSIRTFVNFFKDDLNNCADWLAIFDAITTEPQPCDNGDEGFFQVSKGTADCVDGTPLNAEANFVIDQVNCKDNGTNVTVTGTMNLQLDFSGEGNIGFLSADGLIVQGFGFSFESFRTRVDFSNSSLSCSDSGEVTVSEAGVPDQTCNVSSSCRTCSL